MEQSARDFLTSLASSIAAGQSDVAQANLAQLLRLCPSACSIQVGTSLIDLEALIALIGSNPSQAIAGINAVVANPNLIRFVCGDILVASLDLDEGFPTGSTG